MNKCNDSYYFYDILNIYSNEIYSKEVPAFLHIQKFIRLIRNITEGK
jgi:hypothetical protein